MKKKQDHTTLLKKGSIAGELNQNAARKQLHQSLVPLQWLADKNGFTNVAKLIEQAIDELSRK